MTIRKQWLIIIGIIVFMTIAVNSLVLSKLVDIYFVDYVKENYDKNISEIIDYVTKTLNEDDFDKNQIMIKLESYLDEPIQRIKLYDNNNNLITDVFQNNYIKENSHMMGQMNGMKDRMGDNDSQFEETDKIELENNGQQIGLLLITRSGTIEDSETIKQFKSYLLKNSLLVSSSVLLIAVVFVIIISKKMSKELILTAEFAQSIDLGNDFNILESNIKEIQIIRQSLSLLKTKLKLKQKSRKQLIDELIHQTRTPLTILKSHIEGFEDGIIDLNKDEVSVCESQIDSIANIMSDMGSVIDSKKDEEILNIGEFEIKTLLLQIKNGLQQMFDKKNIKLIFKGNDKIIMWTDKYKLSQSVYNLLINAYKYTNNGTVKFEYEIFENSVLISIKDSGIGMTKEEQEKIFNAYYRSDRVRNVDGEGIGLYVVDKNIKSLQGTISVESQKDMGSLFTIKIPIKISKT